MFSFGKKTGLFSTREEDNNHSTKENWGFCKLFALKHFVPNLEHHASNDNNTLKQDHTKRFICHPENKIIHHFKGEICRPIVPLPTSLVTEIVSQKEGRIHVLEEKISHLQNEFQKTKMKSRRELKRLWSHGNSCMKRRKQSTSLHRNIAINLQKSLSSPNLTWGRRGQLISLLKYIKGTVKSANNSRENIFPRWNHRQSTLQVSTRKDTSIQSKKYKNTTPLTNDIEVQLWVWMEKINELEKETCNIRYDRDNMEKALEQYYKESMEIEHQIMSLKKYQEKEEHDNNILLKDLEGKFNLDKERFDTSVKSNDEKIHRLMLSLEDQKHWLEKLQVHCQDLKENKEMIQRNEIEGNQLLCSIEASKINLNESMEYLEKNMIEAKEYTSKLLSLRGNFESQLKKWENESSEVWKEISRVERIHQHSLSEIEKLNSEIQEYKSKCSVLEEEKLSLNEKISFYEQQSGKEKKDLELKISNLRAKLKSTKLRLTEETKSRMDMEDKLKILNENKIKLENDFKKENEVCCSVLKELQVIKNTFEIEKKKFESARKILDSKNNEEKELENLNVKKALEDLELEKQRHNECRRILEDEKKKQSLILDIESGYNQALQEKEHLSVIIAQNESKIQILEEKIIALDEELNSEKSKLRSITESFNEETAKCEKIHNILHDLTAETLKKERLIKSMTDELKSKDSIESQLRSTNEKLEESILKCGILSTQLEGEKSKSKDLTIRCEDLVNTLSREKSQCVMLNEKLMTVTNNFMNKIHHLEKELDNKNLQIEEDAKAHKNLEMKIEELTKDLKEERLNCNTELESVKIINIKLHKDLHAALSEVETYKIKVEEMSKSHNDEIKKLMAKVANEQCKFENASEKIEELQLKLKEIINKTGSDSERMLNAMKELAAVRENEEFIQRMYQERQKEIDSLQKNLENEKFKTIVAEKDIESLNSKIEELQNIHAKEKEIAMEKIKELTMKVENRELMNQDLKKEIFYLKASLEDHDNQEMAAQDNFQKLMMKEREMIKAQINENKLLVEEIRKLKTELKHTEAIQIVNHEYKNEIKCLQLSIKTEQSNRLKAEEEIEKLLKEIAEMNRIHLKEKIQIQQDLKCKISENERIVHEEQKKYKEMEERLIKEKDELAENLKYIENQYMVVSSNGGSRLDQRSFFCDDVVGSLSADEKIKGIKDFHEKLADKICFRNLSEVTAIRRTAGIEILQLREELNSLKRQLLSERTAHKISVMNLENNLQESYSLLQSKNKDELEPI